jgi:hypothetical protein
MTDLIVVIGPRRSSTTGTSQFWGFGVNESGGYETDPQLYPVDSEGGGGGTWENELAEIHTAQCQTGRDAAKSISSTIMRTDDTGSPNNWQKFEYGATIVKNGDRYAAFNSKVYTDWLPTEVHLGAPPTSSELIAGLIHNHPRKASHFDNLESRYPIEDDIDRMVQLVADGVYPSTSSFFILDPFGDTREFPYSTIQNYRNANMSRPDRLAGNDLPAPILEENCVDL